jgi:hypothetical protein
MPVVNQTPYLRATARFRFRQEGWECIAETVCFCGGLRQHYLQSTMVTVFPELRMALSQRFVREMMAQNGASLFVN